MPSRTSKPSKTRKNPWKAEPGCSEQELEKLASSLASEVRTGDRILLEGEMGAGKTTFARALLSALGVTEPPEGSPTFAIAHEYQARLGGVVHIDLYRLRAEAELDQAGIPEYFWSRPLIVICEWLSMWPDFEQKVKSSGPYWKVALEPVEGSPALRSVIITRS